jgi:hypothetical protein
MTSWAVIRCVIACRRSYTCIYIGGTSVSRRGPMRRWGWDIGVDEKSAKLITKFPFTCHATVWVGSSVLYFCLPLYLCYRLWPTDCIIVALFWVWWILYNMGSAVFRIGHRKRKQGSCLWSTLAKQFGGHALLFYMSQDWSTIVLVNTCFNLTRGVFCYMYIVMCIPIRLN